MDEQPQIFKTPPGPLPPTSLAARLLNVFATPGEVFEEVKAAPATVSNWLVPALVAAIVGVISVFIVFSQPAMLQQIREQQGKMFDSQVKAGKMSRAEADKALATAEKFMGPTVMKFTGSIGAVVVSFVRVFWWAFVLWLIGLVFLKVRFGYLKALEVAGLASMISVLGAIVAVLLTVNFGKASSANLDLAFSTTDPNSKMRPMLAALDIFNFWLVGVMAAGLARLAGVRFARAFLLVMGYWLLLQFVLLSLATLLGGAMGGTK